MGQGQGFLIKRHDANRYSCVIKVGRKLFERVDSIIDHGACAGCERRWKGWTEGGQYLSLMLIDKLAY